MGMASGPGLAWRSQTPSQVVPRALLSSMILLALLIRRYLPQRMRKQAFSKRPKATLSHPCSPPQANAFSSSS